jgi:hypothetical protein
MIGSPKSENKTVLALALLAISLVVGCSKVPENDDIVVAPATASILTTETQAFTASVANSPPPAVTWWVDGVRSGNVDVGTISAAGIYSPPDLPGTHSIAAVSNSDPSKRGGASIVVNLPGSI